MKIPFLLRVTLPSGLRIFKYLRTSSWALLQWLMCSVGIGLIMSQSFQGKDLKLD